MVTISTNKLFRLALIAVIALLAIGISPGSGGEAHSSAFARTVGRSG